MFGIFFFAAVIVAGVAYNKNRKRKISAYKLPADAAALLEQNVVFYKQLNQAQKRIFESRVRDFLANTTIRGVDTEIDDLDKLLVASGAIIPIFAFPDWRYNNISEVLIYKDSFNKDFQTTGTGRNIGGMVGTGAMQRMMLLSKPALRQSFSDELDGQNTVIHEFVHLIDKADGSIDGVPEYLVRHPSVIPWIKLMAEKIRDIRTGEIADIDDYGATNDAEFLAVVSEYFFERPEKLKANHPDLYAMLVKMFERKQ